MFAAKTPQEAQRGVDWTGTWSLRSAPAGNCPHRFLSPDVKDCRAGPRHSKGSAGDNAELGLRRPAPNG